MKNNVLSEINEIYNLNIDLPVEFINVIKNPNKYNDSNKRVLSLSEILDANNDMQVDFISLKLIPIIDCFDNDIICYDLNYKNWTMFNIAENIKFNSKKSLDELISFKE